MVASFSSFGNSVIDPVFRVLGFVIERELTGYDRDHWNRWHHLCKKYDLLLPVSPTTELNYMRPLKTRLATNIMTNQSRKVFRYNDIWRTPPRASCRRQSTNTCHPISIVRSFGFSNFCTSLCGNNTRKSSGSKTRRRERSINGPKDMPAGCKLMMDQIMTFSGRCVRWRNTL